ncbi:MAG TPA: alanine--glyoxylate aminotransferase family protein [Solirubrobacteraceae bacterium]|jgi:pyridoxamine--pyruvate transaminase|nr:alanine--glyoxylate aminotransferase family protein [Solirubrobacteraceae bacterium]
MQVPYDYSSDFLEAFARTQRKVAEILKTSADVVLMQGEAMLAIEAATRSLVAPGDRCLNLVSGAYGQGYGDLLRRLGAEVVDVQAPFDSTVEPEQVAAALEANPLASIVSMVHCETPTGTLTPVGEIAPIAKRHGAITVVDAASSAGGAPLAVDDWGIDVCVTAPQKCLGSVPGLAIVSVSDVAWERMANNPGAPRGSYLSLLDWKELWEDRGVFPHTPSVTDVMALDAACTELLAEGLDTSLAIHARAGRACRAGVRAAGLEIWPSSDEVASPTVTAVRLPDGVSERDLRAVMLEHLNVNLPIASGGFADRIMRIGHMGITARAPYPLVGVATLVQGLALLGEAVDIGAAAEASLAELVRPLDVTAG